jgi:hypothetical protein
LVLVELVVQAQTVEQAVVIHHSIVKPQLEAVVVAQTVTLQI